MTDPLGSRQPSLQLLDPIEYCFDVRHISKLALSMHSAFRKADASEQLPHAFQHRLASDLTRRKDQRQAFETLEAKSAQDALKILAERPDVRLLFTDMNMPGMSGIELVEQVHQRWPKILLIVTSSDRAVAERHLPDDGRFVAKPYEAGELTGEIDDLLKRH